MSSIDYHWRFLVLFPFLDLATAILLEYLLHGYSWCLCGVRYGFNVNRLHSMDAIGAWLWIKWCWCHKLDIFGVATTSQSIFVGFRLGMSLTCLSVSKFLRSLKTFYLSRMDKALRDFDGTPNKSQRIEHADSIWLLLIHRFISFLKI